MQSSDPHLFITFSIQSGHEMDRFSVRSKSGMDFKNPIPPYVPVVGVPIEFLCF